MFEKDHLFWFSALAGSGAFLIQLCLYLFGSDFDDLDDSSSHNFKLLSKQTLTGFFMIFGWIGLACKNELGYSPLASMGIAVAAGLCAMGVIGSIFHFSKKLRSSGSVFRIEEVIEKEASVYQRIPKEGAGKIFVTIQEISHEIDAISLNGVEIPSFRQVKIMKKIDERTVAVVPINE